MKTKLEKITSALNALNVRPYRCESCRPLYDAQRNLQGRTHYVDDDTLKAFRAKVLDAGNTENGLLYYLVESVQSRPNHGGYNKRGIVFDVFGTIINERADMAETQGEWFKDSAKAHKSVMEFVRTFDAEKHTAAELERTARRNIADAKNVLALLKGRSI